MKKILQKIFPKKFGPYWKSIRNNENLDKDLKYISDKFLNSESYDYVSNQWHLLNISDYKSIINNNSKNYGTDIFTHYCTFVDYKDEHLNNLFTNINYDEINNYNVNLFKKHNNFNLKDSSTYNYLCLLLYENLKKTENYKYLKNLKDKSFLGFDDPYITIDNINITEDKLVSLFDLEKIDKFKKINDGEKILELGAGSGRLADCILSIKNNINYTISDIPPSIYISYKRLKLSFPDKKIKLLIDCEDGEVLNKSINDNDISFVFPHQLKKIDTNFYNMVLAIDCLHEMDKETLNKYFKIISHITKNIYFSIWNKTKNWYSGNLFKKTERLDFDKGDYPIPKDWEIILKENLKFPSNHLGIGYNINNKKLKK